MSDFSALLRNYELNGAFDEMVQSDGATVRPHYEALAKHLLDLAPEEMRRRKQASDLSFLHQGITFTVYGRDEGIEKIFPHDLLPRIIRRDEW